MRDALSQIPPCWNCCGTLGNFVAQNSSRSDVWRCLIKHVWTAWQRLQTSKCLITKQWWCSVVKHFPFGQGFISCVACHCDIEKSYDLTLTYHSLPSPATKMFTYESQIKRANECKKNIRHINAPQIAKEKNEKENRALEWTMSITTERCDTRCVAGRVLVVQHFASLA